MITEKDYIVIEPDDIEPLFEILKQDVVSVKEYSRLAFCDVSTVYKAIKARKISGVYTDDIKTYIPLNESSLSACYEWQDLWIETNEVKQWDGFEKGRPIFNLGFALYMHLHNTSGKLAEEFKKQRTGTMKIVSTKNLKYRNR